MAEGKSYDVILTCNYSPWSAYAGGGQKSTHMVAEALARLGLKVCVIYSKAPWEKVGTPAGLGYDTAWAAFFAFKPGISSPFRFLNGISFYRQVVRRSGPGTVIHGNGDEAALLGFVRSKRRFVYSNRYPRFEDFLAGTDWSRPRSWIRILLREPRYVAMALALRRAETVFCTSADSARRLRECFPVEPARVRVVPNGIDPAFFATAPATPDGERERSGVLFYGRLTRAKGVEDLLRAYASLPATVRAAHALTLVGDGPFRPEAERLAAGLGVSSRMRILPWMDSASLAREMAAHSLVALPSHEESFGNTMLETLAAGRRLLTTDAGSIPEVVAGHAVMVPPGSPALLSAAMERMLAEAEDPEALRRGVDYVRGRFSWDGTARMMLESYGGLGTEP